MHVYFSVTLYTKTLFIRVHTTLTNTGVYLDYYNGGAVSHIVRYEARVYFVCMANVTLDGPHFEHMKDSSAVHFRVNTKYACVQ